MILTQCAVCATELGLSLGKKCGRCSTRYCGAECQKQHWEGGGHDQLCKKIKKAGGAEVYNANEKYTEAVAVAAEACADDTKGQTCYICTKALHWKTKEGLVRMCACRGTAGFAHVSCLAEEAKILFDEAVENNLGEKAWDARWQRWHTCSLCEQQYHGVVMCALGWACWKTYVGRPERDGPRINAMRLLGLGLFDAGHNEDALSVQEAELSMWRRVGASGVRILDVQTNLSNTYAQMGRLGQVLQMDQDIYRGRVKFHGEEDITTLNAASNYANSLTGHLRFKEAKSLLGKTMPVARRILGESNDITLRLKKIYGRALHEDPGATLDDLREAVTMLEDAARIARRVMGGAHPVTNSIEIHLRGAWAALRARETPPTSG